MSVKSKVCDSPKLKDKDMFPNDEMPVYFNLGMCAGIGLICIYKFINARTMK